MISGATVLTNNQRDLNKLVKQNLNQDANLDEVLEQLLDVQRRKTKKMEKQF